MQDSLNNPWHQSIFIHTNVFPFQHTDQKWDQHAWQSKAAIELLCKSRILSFRKGTSKSFYHILLKLQKKIVKKHLSFSSDCLTGFVIGFCTFFSSGLALFLCFFFGFDFFIKLWFFFCFVLVLVLFSIGFGFSFVLFCFVWFGFGFCLDIGRVLVMILILGLVRFLFVMVFFFVLV